MGVGKRASSSTQIFRGAFRPIVSGTKIDTSRQRYWDDFAPIHAMTLSHIYLLLLHEALSNMIQVLYFQIRKTLALARRGSFEPVAE